MGVRKGECASGKKLVGVRGSSEEGVLLEKSNSFYGVNHKIQSIYG